MQDMLFGAAWGGQDEPSGPDDQLRLAALNVQGGPPGRVVQLMQWIISTQADVVVLSEIRSQNVETIAGELRAMQYDVREPGAGGSDRSVLLAARAALKVSYPSTMDRVGVITVHRDDHDLTVIGVYAPTNGMTAESSAGRAAWQSEFLRYVGDLTLASPTIITGDLNVLEPGHVPANPHFEDHDYRFYDGLVRLGYQDGYRHLQPTESEHSWSSPRFGSQRLDHTFVSAAHNAALRSCGYDGAPLHSGLSDHRAMVTELDLAKLRSSAHSE